MSENENKPPSSLDLKLQLLSIQARSAVLSAEGEVRYRTLVTTREDKEALKEARTFFSEFLNFLREYPATTLTPLKLTSNQLTTFYDLFKAAEGKTLLPVAIKRNVTLKGYPFLGLHYGCNPKNEIHKPRISIWYDVKTRSPIRGFILGPNEGMIEFMFLPNKTQDRSYFEKYIEGKSKKYTTQAVTSENHERIVVNTTINDPKEDFALSQQFFYLGAFDGEETGKTYYVYGSNHHNQITTAVLSKATDRVSVGQPIQVTFPNR